MGTKPRFLREIAEDLHFLISRQLSAQSIGHCVGYLPGVATNGELRVAEKKSEILWREILCRPGLQPRSCHEGGFRLIDRLKSSFQSVLEMQNTGHFNLVPKTIFKHVQLLP